MSGSPRILLQALVAITLLTVAGCGYSKNRMLESEASQVRTRSIQTRGFETNDKEHVMRAVMATLQDLGFVLDSADFELGSITATKMDNYSLRMTVSTRNKGDKLVLVRSNAQYQLRSVDDPKIYAQFFDALGKSLFLAAQQVD